MSAIESRLSTSEHRPAKEKGQVLIIVVFAIIGLIAFIGLVVDLGLVYIGHGQLRRSVDAAALAASLQYREGYQLVDLQRSATEFLALNGINDPSVTIATCDENLALCDKNGDGTVTQDEQRKLIQVVASSNVHLAFLPVIGITDVPLQAEAVSEAASVDVVIAIDRSESMTYNADPGDPMRDPSQCNADAPTAAFTGSCSPFTDVKLAADSFVDQLFFPYDRVAIVTFDRLIHCSTCPNAGDHLSLGLTSNENQIKNIIRHLWVYQAGGDNFPGVDVGYDGEQCNDRPGYDLTPRYGDLPQTAGPCRLYDNVTHNYSLFDCPSYYVDHDASSCTTTNIGGGLLAAGNEFAVDMRQEALWVVILLTDGAANSSTDASGNLPFGFCPEGEKNYQPFCRDNEYAGLVNGLPTYDQTRHCYTPDIGVPFDNHVICMSVTDPTWDTAGTVDDGSNYDADDFARDMADWLSQNNVLTFSIGLGDLVTQASADPTKGDPRDGEELLKYVAGVGKGEYFFAPDSSELRQIFAKIADNIATRLTR